MLNLRRCAVGVVAVLAVGGLASAQTSTPAVAQMTDPTIYIGPPVRDGFIDTNNAIADSIKDIKNVFRQRIKQVRIVDAPEAALELAELKLRGLAVLGAETLEHLVANASSEAVRLAAARDLVDRSVGKARERVDVAAQVVVHRPW